MCLMTLASISALCEGTETQKLKIGHQWRNSLMKQNSNVIQKELEQRLAALAEKHKAERIKLDERHSSERKSTEARYEQRIKGLAREGKRVH